MPRPWSLAWRTLSAFGRARPWRLLSTDTAVPPPLTLRSYQEECIQAVLEALALGKRRLGISLATGAGKTVIFTQLLGRVAPPTPAATQTLILAHRRELVEQAARHCTRAYPGKTVDIEMGSLHASGAADITVASIQSLVSGDRLQKFDPARYKLLLVDEAHHIVAPGYMRTLAHFGLAETPASPAGPALVGVSATLSRFDGLALGAAIDEIVYHRDYIDMIGDGWLSDVVFTTVESTADLSRVRSGGLGADFRAADLARAVNTREANDVTVRTWLAKAHAAGRSSTLVFCVDLAHVADMVATFRAHGIDAQAVTGDTDRRERSRRLDAFKAGEFPVLVNCGVFTEGTDMPNVDCVVLARPTKSRNLLVQMIGRGMRLHAGKANCHVIDMVASLETGIVTTPTLFGLDPGAVLDEASVDQMQALKDRPNDADKAPAAHRRTTPNGAPITSVSLTEYDSILDLIQDTAHERPVRVLSQNAWVGVGRDKYVLSGPTGTFLRIERIGPDPDDPNEAKDDNDAKDNVPPEVRAKFRARSDPPAAFRAVEVRALPKGLAKSPFAAPREVAQAATLEAAVRAADRYAATLFPHVFVHRHQPWRKGAPTQGQLDFINKVRGADQEPLTAADIDKGKASDMITKIKHGARGRFADHTALRKRRDKQDERERLQREREQVSVGPLV